MYNEKEKVSKFDDVAEILSGKENVRIKVRVTVCGRFLLSLIHVSQVHLNWF
jgi:hypothetical protein